MKKQELLIKLKAKKQIEIVESSEEISKSYLEKSNNSFKAANLLFDNNLFEESISLAYYSVYNTLMALFFKVGMKCKNHTCFFNIVERIIWSKRTCR